jgi:hypothetical protein
LSAGSINATFLYLPGPGGGMADAEDLKNPAYTEIYQ